MRILISEVWNDTGKSVQLAVINGGHAPRLAVYDWITDHRPDLSLACTLYDHGYHAKETTKEITDLNRDESRSLKEVGL